MFLLNKYKNKKIVVAHVNYNQRSDSIVDEEIVTSFCQKHSIKLHILKVAKTPYGNFQSWARKIRYDFFKEIYEKYLCKKILIAHHKDDFLETALMQQKSGRTPRFFGIKRKNKLDNMNFYRPFVNLYWKDFIIKQNKKLKITFAIDSSNAKPIYERNKIRKELATKSIGEKQNMFEWFTIANKILKKKFKRIDRKILKIIKNKHQLIDYRQLVRDQKEVIYEIIHREFQNVKVSTNKINAIIDFINSKEGAKKFIVNQSYHIYKKNGRLFYTK